MSTNFGCCNGTFMPKLKPETQAARREHILDKAELCFARAGFHGTTMQDICKAAAISPGALYVYFDSKEALIAGLCERDRAEFSDKIDRLAKASDFLGALNGIAQHYFHEQPAHKRLMVVEMAVEATRNPRIEQICRPVEKFVHEEFQKLFQRLKDEGRIAPVLDIPSLTQVFHVIGDGLFWRRAVDPTFDARDVLPGVMTTIEALFNPAPSTKPAELGPRINRGPYITQITSDPIPPGHRNHGKYEVGS